MSSFTIFVTADGAGPIMAAMRDLAALGLVTGYLWAPVGASAEHAIVVDGARSRAGSLEEELATLDPDTVRVVAVSRWKDEPGARAALDAGNCVLTSMPSNSKRLHVIIAEPDGSDVAPRVDGGWCNIVVSPEDGYRPSAPHMGWSTSPAPDVEGLRVAHSLAGLAGVLRDQEETWTDDLTPSMRLRVARVYYRRVDGRRVEKAVHKRLFAMNDGLPRVWGRSGRGTHFPDPNAACTALAQRWWEMARSDLLSGREKSEQEGAANIGIAQALKLFVTFVLSALVKAPGQWVRAQIRAAREHIIDSVQGHIFGDNSAYQVVLSQDARCGGSRDDVSRALTILDDSLPRVEETRLHHEQTWRALVEGALVLGDGATGGSAMSLEETTEPRTVARPSAIVPSSKDRFELSSWDVRRRLKIDAVESGDSMGTHHLAHRLQGLTRDAALGAAAATELERLQAWWRTQQNTYGGRSAELLAQAHRTAVQEIQTISDRLRTDEEQLALQEEELSGDQKRARRGVLVWFFAGTGFAVIFVILGITSILIPGLAAALAAIAVSAAVLGAFMTFYSSQRRLFHVLHEMQRTADEAPMLSRNRRAAIADARRTLEAYRIHQQWMSVLREFLQDPFGAGSLSVQEDPDVSGNLPLAAAIGIGEADQTLVAREVHRLQRKFFGQGWLHSLWAAYLDALPGHLGVDGVHLETAKEIFSMRSDDAHANLAAVIAATTRLGQPSSVGLQAWDAALSELQAARSQGRELLPSVRLLGSGKEIGRDQFDGHFAQGRSSSPFRQQLFDATATTAGMNIPEDIWLHARSKGLSESVVAVTYSPAIGADRLVRFNDQAPRHHGPDDNDAESEDDRGLY